MTFPVKSLSWGKKGGMLAPDFGFDPSVFLDEEFSSGRLAWPPGYSDRPSVPHYLSTAR